MGTVGTGGHLGENSLMFGFFNSVNQEVEGLLLVTQS